MFAWSVYHRLKLALSLTSFPEHYHHVELGSAVPLSRPSKSTPIVAAMEKINLVYDLRDTTLKLYVSSSRNPVTSRTRLKLKWRSQNDWPDGRSLRWEGWQCSNVRSSSSLALSLVAILPPGSRERANKNLIRLPDYDPQEFELLVQWLFTGGYSLGFKAGSNPPLMCSESCDCIDCSGRTSTLNFLFWTEG